MWERRSLKIPFLAWIDKPEASLFRCDGLDSARKAIIARSATKLTWRKQLGPPKGQDINSFFFPLHATTSREKREESLSETRRNVGAIPLVAVASFFRTFGHCRLSSNY